MERSRTIRWTRVEDAERLINTLVSHRSPARCECAVVADRVYARTAAADSLLDDPRFSGGWFLADQTEVFMLQAPSPPAAIELAKILTGPGGLSSITEVKVDEAEILVELAGNPQLFFAFIDQVAGVGVISRRAVLRLHDITLTSVAAIGWNIDDFSPQRILEVAAGEDTW